MVLINGKYQFIVYDLDTLQSVIERLAAEMKTIPKYLYFPEDIPSILDFHTKDKNINVEDLLEIITSDDVEYDFIPIFNKLKDKISQQNLDMCIDILYPFIAFNKALESQPAGQMRDVYILLMQTQIDNANIFEQKQDVQKIWDRDRKKIVTNITKSINTNKNKVEKQKVLLKQFDNISEIIPYTKFELQKINFEFTLDMVHLSIMELFNHIQLNTGVPFACINKFFKILKDFIPSEEWGFYSESTIILKILQKAEIVGSKFNDYTDAYMSIFGSPGEEKVTVGMTLQTSGQYLSRDKMIERFISTIKGLGEIKINNINESKVNGVFYFPKHEINNYVLSDIIMNNPLFSSLISVDESVAATKKKGSIYIHFYHPKTGNISANITEKISEKGDPVLRGKDIKDEFKIGTKYIRVKISSADNLKSVEIFQDMLSKLLVLYDNDYQNIVEFYKQYIPTFAEKTVQPLQVPQVFKLKDIAPEVFVRGYPPKCPHQPSIIDDDELKEAEMKGYIVMRYPQEENEGFVPRNYICEHKNAKYPGLRANPLYNRDLVPYLPCCYTKNHAERKGTIYRHYYFGEELRTTEDDEQQDLILTNKFVPRNKYGTLPEDITKLFNIFDYNEKYIYVRKGVFDSRSSFLECVMEGMYEETGILDLDDKDEREAYLYQIREKLANASNASACRQEMYDFTTEEIITAIRDKDVYMNPKLFISMLEEYFNCNIYVFNRTGIRFGQLTLPRYLQAYYKTKRRAKSIFVYEHMGSSSDHAEYPRCELIVRWRVGGGKEEDVSYYSSYDSEISQGINRVFNQLRKTYVLNMEIIETEFPIIKSGIKLIEQGIDSYGKCRMIRFEYDNNIGTLITSPIQPLAIPEVRGWVATKIDQELAIQFAAYLGIIISGQSVQNDVVKELYGILGNVRISIPVDDGIPMDGIPLIDKGISYPENKISVIENYNKYKKLARYITEYMYWLFSLYLYEDETRDMSLETIESFVKDKIKLVPDFEYGYVGKLFSINSGVMDDGKLVIKSEEALKRLVYTLRVYIRRFSQKIRKYHTRKVIENYYVDIIDFDYHQFQVILHGEDSVEKWIQEQKIKYNLYNSVQTSKIIPYFFQNNLVGPRIYLAQNTHNVYKAIEIAKVWLQSGYNIGADPKMVEEQNILKFTLYRYINPNDIKIYNVGNIPTPLDIRILGYKIDDESFYTVLLPL